MPTGAHLRGPKFVQQDSKAPMAQLPKDALLRDGVVAAHGWPVARVAKENYGWRFFLLATHFHQSGTILFASRLVE